jgi:hypothetical protein
MPGAVDLRPGPRQQRQCAALNFCISPRFYFANPESLSMKITRLIVAATMLGAATLMTACETTNNTGTFTGVRPGVRNQYKWA